MALPCNHHASSEVINDMESPYNQYEEREADEDLDLTPEQIRELKRRIKDSENQVRYVIYTDLLPRGRWRLFFNVSEDTWCDDVNAATLFKRDYYAQAVIDQYCQGGERDLFIAKITTRNNKRKVLEYHRKEHRTTASRRPQAVG